MRHEPPTGQGWRKGGATNAHETGFLQSKKTGQDTDSCPAVPRINLIRGTLVSLRHRFFHRAEKK
jgi:hypothetical protein